ncbi:MAG: translation initiation factor IF-2 [Armatimonadota bacterium]
MRVYELASQLGVSSREILLLLEELGVGGKTASSAVPPVYLGPIRSRLSGEAPPAPQARTASAQAAPAAAPPVMPAPAAEPETQAPTPVLERVAEEDGERLRLRAPFTVAEFATALDTDAENIVRAAAELGETVGEGDIIPSELATLIGEQWGYSLHIEEPEPVEQPPAPEPSAEVQAEAAEEAPPAKTAAAEKPAPPPLRVVPRREAPADAPPRPPVVTVLGHVDHGKTTLLDAIRHTNVTAQEPGAITQHIGAYQVEVNGRPITFIDTPGHEAFTAMRARGAQVTDIAVLVVAADDGVMPQTLEAIDHARAAGVPIIVAVNKVDRPTASPDAVRQRLSERGLVPEEWGGDTIYVNVSALEKTGITDLLEMILLVAEMRDLRALRDKPAEGAVLEAELDKRRGAVATLLVQEGTLHVGDSIVVGPIAGKVRAMTDDRGRRLKEALPSTPVQVIGMSDVPEASELFRVVESDRTARTLAAEQQMTQRESTLRPTGPSSMAELSQLFAVGQVKTLNLILKGDTQGTVEAIANALRQIVSEEVTANILHTGVGDVTESDVSLAAATKPTVIIGFQVGADPQARRLAADERVEVRLYEIIYDLLDDVRDTMLGMLESKIEETVIGQAEVRALFQSSRLGTIAGCYVLGGRMVRGSRARVRRRGDVVWEGTISSMRHLQEDVTEIQQGFECGIVLAGFSDLQVGDVIECVEERELRRSVL